LSRRIAAFGRNEIPSKPPKIFLHIMLDASLDVKFVKIILFALLLFALSFYYPSGETFEADKRPSKVIIKTKRRICFDLFNYLEEINVPWIGSSAIIIVVLAVVLVTAFHDWTKERQFRVLKLKMELDQKFNVIRQNTIQQIPIKTIVVGDLLNIKSGDSLPADGLLVESNDLKVDESSLTGESNLIKKHQSEDPFLLSG
jgi:Ca2+ transporting ATPase